MQSCRASDPSISIGELMRRDVRLRVGPDFFGLQQPTVVKLDGNVFERRLVDHVRVRHDEESGGLDAGHDHARAGLFLTSASGDFPFALDVNDGGRADGGDLGQQIAAVLKARSVLAEFAVQPFGRGPVQWFRLHAAME